MNSMVNTINFNMGYHDYSISGGFWTDTKPAVVIFKNLTYYRRLFQPLVF